MQVQVQGGAGAGEVSRQVMVDGVPHPLLPKLLHHTKHSCTEEHLEVEEVEVEEDLDLCMAKPVLLLLQADGGHDDHGHPLLLLLLRHLG